MVVIRHLVSFYALKEESKHLSAFICSAGIVWTENVEHFQIDPHYYEQYVSLDLYFLALEVTNNYNPTSSSEGPIET